MSNPLKSLTEEYLPAIDTEMRSVLHEPDGMAPADDLFYGMIHYHMGWKDQDLERMMLNSGKRIRPLLSLLTCNAAGGAWEQAVPAAAAIEIIHNFSLVHDDIQDASDTRRGRQTVWTLWGAPQAINTGDAMFAMAHLSLNRLADRGVPPANVVRAFRRFDETCVRLTQGQYADMSFETRDDVTTDEYMDMITGKTAVLIALSAELGALIAGADDETINHYATFGRDLGLAFQIQDDILGIWGDESLTGKSAATDIETRKKSLPVLYGLEQSAALRDLYAQPDGSNDNFVRDAVTSLDATDARAYATELVTEYSNSALGNLEAAAPQGDAGVALFQLTDQLLHRNY
ncbi:MAG: polyprenyl synthetase family protein [Chloroflexota bacterium]